MRLLITTDTLGGVWTYTLELARALRPAQVELVLATMGNPLSEVQRQQAAHLDNVQLAQSTYKLEWMADPWEDVSRAGQWLLELERQHRPDVIHLNGYAHGVLPFAAPRLIAAHSCVLSWWRAVKGEEAPPEWNRYRQAVATGLRSVQMVVAPSRAMLNA
ncbi:MAG TPA: glycosyltransferase family 4 protein, partial [Tepidisphaeraceae bacterium]|nr:glycosyltransferase family 4 protein [Tepidisphaeraceae bacterium]